MNNDRYIIWYTLSNGINIYDIEFKLIKYLNS